MLESRVKDSGWGGTGEVVADETDLQNNRELIRYQHHFTDF